MKKITFKEFNSILESLEQDNLTEQQLDEIFDKLMSKISNSLRDRHERKVKELVAKRTKERAAKNAALKAKQDQQNFKHYGNGNESNPKLGGASQAARDKAGERAWHADLQANSST